MRARVVCNVDGDRDNARLQRGRPAWQQPCALFADRGTMADASSWQRVQLLQCTRVGVPHARELQRSCTIAPPSVPSHPFSRRATCKTSALDPPRKTPPLVLTGSGLLLPQV